AEHFDRLAVHGDRVFPVRHLIRQIAENRIVFEQVRERLRIRNIVHGDDFNRGITQRRAENIAADASKTVDSYLDWHSSSAKSELALQKTNKDFPAAGRLQTHRWLPRTTILP